jgi:hypothetical protein
MKAIVLSPGTKKLVGNERILPHGARLSTSGICAVNDSNLGFKHNLYHLHDAVVATYDDVRV